MRTVGWSSHCTDSALTPGGPAAPQGPSRQRGHGQAWGHASTRGQQRICAQPVTLSAESGSEPSESKWDWRNLKRGWLQAGAGVSSAALVAVNVAPLLAQTGGKGGSGDGTDGGGGGGGDGDGPGGRNHLYDLAEDAAQG